MVCGGVSSFAYQGTNSHAVLCTSIPSQASPQSLMWQRVTAWYQASIHPVLQFFLNVPQFRTSTSALEVRLKGNVQHPSFSYLIENGLFNQTIMAPGALLEICTAAGHLLVEHNHADRFGHGSPVHANLQPAMFTSETPLLVCFFHAGIISMQIAGPCAHYSANVTYLQAHWHSDPLRSNGTGFWAASQSSSPHLDNFSSLSAQCTQSALRWLRGSSCGPFEVGIGTVTCGQHLVGGYCTHPTLSEAPLQLLGVCQQQPSMLCACGMYLPDRKESGGVLFSAALQFTSGESFVHLEKDAQQLLRVHETLVKELTTMSQATSIAPHDPSHLSTSCVKSSTYQGLWRRMLPSQTSVW
jgi:hypothetical protein